MDLWEFPRFLGILENVGGFMGIPEIFFGIPENYRIPEGIPWILVKIRKCCWNFREFPSGFPEFWLK